MTPRAAYGPAEVTDMEIRDGKLVSVDGLSTEAAAIVASLGDYPELSSAAFAMHGVQVTLTYGEMPSRRQFDRAWDLMRPETDDGEEGFAFGNDKRVGTCVMTCGQLWAELEKAADEYSGLLDGDTDQDPEAVGSWIADVLGCLGFEWV